MFSTIKIGSIILPTYWLMLFIGTLGMMVYLWCDRERFSLSHLSCILFTFVLTITGFLGAKLLFVLENLKTVLDGSISLRGVSFFGSVFLIPLCMPIIGKLFHLKANQTLDICAPCVAIMIGCMRVGCFFSGCCGGWEFFIADISFHWPTQAMESIGDFLILGLLLSLGEEKVHSGKLYPIFMLTYSILRFFIEFLRDTPKNWICMSHGQWFAIVAIIVGFMWIKLKNREVKYENNT